MNYRSGFRRVVFYRAFLHCGHEWRKNVGKSGFGKIADPDSWILFFNVLFCTVAWNGVGGLKSGSEKFLDPDFGVLFFNVLFCTVAWNGVGGLKSGSEKFLDPDFGVLFFNVLFCTVAWVGGGGDGNSGGGGGDADGRLSVSATTFLVPGTCLKSVVNSEMYAN